MIRFSFTPEAERDVDEISDYLAGLSPQPAIRIGREIQRTIRSIQTFPAAGRIDKKQSRLAQVTIYRIVSGDYILFYTILPTRILFSGVVHGRRDVEDIISRRHKHS